MSRDPDRYDFFVSYARQDNADGWIEAFVQQLVAQHEQFSGGRRLTCFFDHHEIRNLADWRLAIYEGLSASRLFLGFVSPNYFSSEWCRREWRRWIELEISKHILSSGASPIYIIEVPGLTDRLTEKAVASQNAKLCGHIGSPEIFADEAMPVIKQMRQRQILNVRPFYSAGLEALRRDDAQQVMQRLATDLDGRADLVRLGSQSESNVPPYNTRFTGRIDELVKLREQLVSDRAGAISALHGLGGIGKTELALTYAHAFGSAYPGGRFLVPCDGHENLRDAAISLDEVFGEGISNEERKTPDRHYAAIRTRLRHRMNELGSMLLVLDNVSDFGLLSSNQTDLLTAISPKLHLLVTTRLSRGPTSEVGRIRWLTLRELSERDSLTLLEKHRDFADDAERAAGREIVKRLGGFALALELVATWLAANPQVSCAGFLQRMKLETLKELADDENVELRRHNHQRSLDAVLGPTLEAVALANPAARRAMDYAAFLPPENAPLGWLKYLVSAEFPELKEASQPGFLDTWMVSCKLLWKYGLISKAERGTEQNEDPIVPKVVRVHRLVQELIRGKLFAEDRASILGKLNDLAIVRVARLFLDGWHDARWEVEPLERVLLQNFDAPGLVYGVTLHRLGNILTDLAEWSRAEILYRRAVASIEQRIGGCIHVPLLNSLGQLLTETNRLVEAELVLRKAVTLKERDPDDRQNLAHVLISLSGVLADLDRLPEAEEIARRALALLEDSCEAGDTAIACGLNNLAAVLSDTDKLPEAELLVRRSLAIHEAEQGPTHSNIASDLSILISILRTTGRIAETEPLCRRELKIEEAVSGPNHPRVAVALNNLARWHLSNKQPNDAEHLHRRALSIDEASFGAMHPAVARDLNFLATALLDTNRLDDAEPLIRRAIAINSESLAPHDPKLATQYFELAKLLTARNEFAAAREHYRCALNIFFKYLAWAGIEHDDQADAISNYSALLKQMGRNYDERQEEIKKLAQSHGLEFKDGCLPFESDVEQTHT